MLTYTISVIILAAAVIVFEHRTAKKSKESLDALHEFGRSARILASHRNCRLNMRRHHI